MSHYNLPTSMEMLLSIALLLPQVLFQNYLLPCIGNTPHHDSCLIIHNNSLINGIIYADFQIDLLHSLKMGNHGTRK